jgi:ribosomal protein S18 acetylase RimI-like enzyme
MQDILQAEEFSVSKLDEVQGFHCGDSPWAIAQSRWITEGLAIKSMSERGTEIWLYYSESGELVGFGSLGKARRPFPPDGKTFVNCSIIPSIAIRSEYQGKPVTPPKYSDQIISDLVAKAQEHGTDLLVLDVVRDNAAAIAVYRRAGFFDTGFVRDGQLKMFRRL